MVWLVNYIPESIRKSVGGFNDKVISLFKTNTPKQTVYGGGKKLSKPKTQNKINSIRNPFILKKKTKEIKNVIIRDIWTLWNRKKKERKTEIRKK